MGYRTQTLVPALSYVAEGAASRLSPGALVAASLACRNALVNPVEAFGRIFLTESTASGYNSVFHLASGYFGWFNPLTWQGVLPVDNNQYIMFILHAPHSFPYRLTWWTMDRESVKAGIIGDP